MKKSNLEKHLIACPHCGKQVLDHFTQCPHCKGELTPSGYTGKHDIKAQEKIRTVLFVILLAVALFVLFVLPNITNP